MLNRVETQKAVRVLNLVCSRGHAWQVPKNSSQRVQQVESEINLMKRMAPQVGLEPTTLRLTAGCSAIELLRSVVRNILEGSGDYR